mmetsp:Transcript_45533/g.140384  ORF Transcript_45533/g.140384 Transcript_45533/m.140384 type:complete len:222 (-) Transcript_45533:20-685(-)
MPAQMTKPRMSAVRPTAMSTAVRSTEARPLRWRSIACCRSMARSTDASTSGTSSASLRAMKAAMAARFCFVASSARSAVSSSRVCSRCAVSRRISICFLRPMRTTACRSLWIVSSVLRVSGFRCSRSCSASRRRFVSVSSRAASCAARRRASGMCARPSDRPSSPRDLDGGGMRGAALPPCRWWRRARASLSRRNVASSSDIPRGRSSAVRLRTTIPEGNQ